MRKGEKIRQLETQVAYLQAIICRDGHKFITIKTERKFNQPGDVDYFITQKCEVCGQMRHGLRL